MRAGSWTTPHAFPSVEPFGTESIARCCRQNGYVGQSPFEEPMGKGSVIPGVVPEKSICLEPIKVLIDVLRDRVSIGKSGGVMAPRLSTLNATELKLLEMPSHDK